MKILKKYTDYKKSGIYCLLNLHNDKIYIGSSSYISKRVWEHFYALKNNNHYNRHLQRSFNKYPNHFIGFVLEDVEIDKLIDREQYWIDELDVCNPEIGYNILPKAYSFIGYSPTEEQRLKQSIAKSGENHPNFGKSLPDSTKKRIGDGNRGKVRSEETKQKLREINVGKKLSDEHKSKISDSLNKRTRTKEELDRVSKLNSKEVYQYDIGLNLVDIFPSAAEAARRLDFKRGLINRACRGERKTYRGFTWSYSPLK